MRALADDKIALRTLDHTRITIAAQAAWEWVGSGRRPRQPGRALLHAGDGTLATIAVPAG